MGDSGEAARAPEGFLFRRRGAGSPPRRRRCSSAGSGNVHPRGARESLGKPQSEAEEDALADVEPRLVTRRRSRFRYSRSTSPSVQALISRLGTSTRSKPGTEASLFSRKLSRSNRRARFRATAPPRRRLAAKPSRLWPQWFSAATRRNREPSNRSPFANTRRNSDPERNRSRGRNAFPFGRAAPGGCANPALLGGDSLPPPLPPPLQDQSPSLGPHPNQKAVSPLALPIVGLKRPLHRRCPLTSVVP